MHSKIYMLNSFGLVLKRSLSAHLMQVKLILFAFYLNGSFYCMQFLSENRLNRCQICARFGFFENPESKQNVSFWHVPPCNALCS